MAQLFLQSPGFAAEQADSGTTLLLSLGTYSTIVDSELFSAPAPPPPVGSTAVLMPCLDCG